MRRGNGVQLGATQTIEVAGSDIFANPINFIHDQVKGLAALTQISHQTLISRVQACSPVNQEQHNIGFINCEARLIGHRGIDTHFLATDTAGINNNKRRIADLPLTVFSVSG